MRICSCGNEVGNFDVVCSKCGADFNSLNAIPDAEYIVKRLWFDHRTQVSADARHIVKHLWIIFVLLPFVLGLLWAIVSAMR